MPGGAFSEVGTAVETWRIHRSIGMNGSTLLDVLSDGAKDEVRQRLKDLHSRRQLPGAPDLLEGVAARGLEVVLATSAPEDELAVLRDVLDSEDLISAVTSSEDVDTAKPEPDIVKRGPVAGRRGQYRATQRRRVAQRTRKRRRRNHFRQRP
jgi:phosphoglycolate phosphatase-like HAD superfamily hydrolase